VGAEAKYPELSYTGAFLCFFIILCAGPVLVGHAQNRTFDHITIEKGLSQNTVNDILKDSRGFMWFATNDGLNRYNGYGIKVYRNDVLDSSSLSDNTIYCLLEDSHQNLWIGTRTGGLNYYSWHTDTFMHFRHEPDDEASLGSNLVRCLFEDRDGRIWIGMLRGGGLGVLDPVQMSIRRIPLPAADSSTADAAHTNVHSIYQDKNGMLWLATDYHGLLAYDPLTGKFSHFPIDPGRKLRSKNIGKTIYEDHAKNIWLCTEGAGLYRFDRVSGTFHRFGDTSPLLLNSNIVKDIAEHRDGSYWIATDGGGLHLYRPAQNDMNHLEFDFQNEKGINSNAIYNIFIDDQGIAWVGTFDGGINIFNPGKYQFAHYTQSKSQSRGLSHKSILCFLEESTGKIWIGTDGGGINVFDRATGSFDHLEHNPLDPGSLSSNVVIDMLEDRKNRIWVGTYNGGLNLYDKTLKRFVHFRTDPDIPNGLSGDNVWALLEDRSGTIWVGTLMGGLHYYDESAQQIVRANSIVERSGLRLNRITNLYEDSRGNMWILGNGLIRWNRSNQQMTRYVSDPSDSMSLSKNDVRSICEDHTGRIWIGTEGGGLNLFDAEHERFTTFNIHDGLPNDAIHAILEDNTAKLWISTNLGLSAFDPETRHIKNYDMQDGLQSNQFSYNAALKSRSGAMFFGGVNGFNMFFPDELTTNPYPPPVYISGFRINNQQVTIHVPGSPLKKQIMETDTIVLQPDQSVFSLTFHALNYTSPEKNHYAYILEGFQEDWNYVGTANTATYTNLDPGWYTFRVKASNNDLVWNDHGASLHIRVLPPFWKTAWAYMLYVVFFLLILYSYRRYSLDRAKLKHDIQIKELEKQKLNEVNQMKLRFFTNISHELRTPLTLILGPLENLSKATTENEDMRWHISMMKKNAERLLHLINQLMQFRAIEKEKEQLKLENADIIGFCREVFNAFIDFAQQHKIDYQFFSTKPALTTWFDPDKIDKILYNLLSNAFKFTSDGGKITLTIETGASGKASSFQRYEKHVLISVRDNGIGISTERQTKIFERFYKIRSNSDRLMRNIGQLGSGIGLAYSQELAEMHHGKIEVESREGDGSIFTVILPIGKPLNDVMADRAYTPGSDGRAALDLYHFLSETRVHVENDGIAHDDHSKNGVPKLMVVDDEADVRDFIKRCLESRFLILEAADGTEAWEIVQKEIPDLVISDVVMPEMDGHGLCHVIKQTESTSHIPVILLTAWDTREQQLKGLHEGADDYIGKPFDTKILEARVNNLIHSRHQLQETYRKRILTEPSEVQVKSSEERFIRKAMQIVESNISNPDFDVSTFVSEIGMSRSVLYRKLQAVTGQSANEFIRFVRLKRSAQLLRLNAFTIAEVCYEVGFNDPQYFSKCFSKQFGMTPSEYAQRSGEKA
jgi:signal transduction histidine kinase/ligand-binding sensor domain-containing protein/DNA-binding response OmpR family regulator